MARLVVELPDDLKDELVRKAKAGDRPISAEVRKALIAHLAAEQKGKG